MVQMTPEKVKLRIKFKKVGKLQYISHLDLVRTMNKIVVRTKLPIWYTEGFNPKPKMAFAAPLSIGTESRCEFMDLVLLEKVDLDQAKAAFNDNMTDEMQVIEAYYPETKFTDLSWLSYTIKITTKAPLQETVDACNAVFLAEEIQVLKNTKSGEKIVDIKPLIKSATAVKDGDAIRINAILSADPSNFLNPEYIIKALREKLEILSSDELTEEGYSIMRECAYLEDMTEFK